MGLAVAKAIPSALMHTFSIKVPPVAEDDKGAGDDDLEQDDDENDTLLIDDFLNLQAEVGLDEHPDLFINPVLTYQIKIAKDKQKEEKRKMEVQASLELEGLSVEQIAERLMEM